jgi:hypothetical protein
MADDPAARFCNERELRDETVGCANRIDHPRLELLPKGRRSDPRDLVSIGGSLRTDAQGDEEVVGVSWRGARRPAKPASAGEVSAGRR